MHLHVDAVVVGGGHAGIEAALALARTGLDTVLITLRADRVGAMSCNPAIGGVGKGQLVRELDALGGEMARAADATAIQFRTLNASKGPAVQSTRCQNDMDRYRATMVATAHSQHGLRIMEGGVERLLVDGARDAVAGVRLADGVEVLARAVVLTTGTFMQGVMHTGRAQSVGGRVGEPASTGLSAHLRELGFRVRRMKTGTPPRLHARSIRWEQLDVQPPETPRPFALDPGHVPLPQVPCHLAYTNATVHDAIRAGLDRSPLFTGVIQGVGPRYCPSIEDKVVRFADKERHHVFLEPCGLDTDEVYPNGLSTSLPADVQLAMVRAIPGLQDAEFIRHGYAVEYDMMPAADLHATLESRRLRGLFCAGQVNGTSGYEEAAAQGLWAGINVSLMLRGMAPMLLRRDRAYMGVMVSDLTERDHAEPYRMLTSRAEHRLWLGEDTAQDRLAEHGHRVGLVDGTRRARVEARASLVRNACAALERDHLVPSDATQARVTALGLSPLPGRMSVAALARRPDTTADQLAALHDGFAALDADARHRVMCEIRYAGYRRNDEEKLRRIRAMDARVLPEHVSRGAVPGLSAEVAEKLRRHGPRTLAEAGQIPGITPAALAILAVHLRRHAGDDGAGPNAP